MGFKDDCETNFGSSELYTILGLNPKDKKKLTIHDVKKAYYKKSLLFHPDKFREEDSKKAYDENGITGEDDDISDWVSIWKKHFKPVTIEDIEAYLKTYTNSDEEKQDIIDAYNKHKGDLNKILECTYNYDVSNIDDLMNLINSMIDDGILEKYSKWKPLSKAKIEKLKKRKEQEKIECETNLKKIKKNGNEVKSLEDMIRERSRKRGQDILMQLEEKYCQPKKKKLRN
ncbi:DnaJ homolog subfamily C member 9 [Strongyloides ratti]|uniref:DnaJ homolog subfamily C member 9 n=1 Tax=Strongyloides ratti TaxID=34506 RepID=A0A090KTT1_STRRB|nr:DnaJ homolog subfamily C member 9 [Strongyloides ratti]CEF60930.2 DnaJ homolog subfamily C member 9 [Strongyloides ratti]